MKFPPFALNIKTFLQLLLVGLLVILFGFLSYKVDPQFVIAGLIAVGIALIVFKNPWVGFLLFVFFIPFERIGSIDIAGITLRPSQLLAALTMIALLFYYLRHKRVNLPSIPILIPFGIFFVVNSIGLLNAPNIERSIVVLLFIVFTFAISIIVPLSVRTKKQVHQLLSVFFLSYTLVTLFGLFQFVGDLVGLPTSITGLRELYTKDILGFPRVQSTALEPLYFANYLLTPLAVLLSLFLARDRSYSQPLILGLLSIGLVNLVLTVARGGYIAFVPVVLILLTYHFFSLFTWRNFFTVMAGGIIGLIVVSKVIGFAVISENFVQHVSNLFEGASFSERVEMYEVAGNAWREHPLVGIGPGSFGPYESNHPYLVADHGWRIVNNEYLELLAETGILGLSAMLLLFVVVIIRSIKAIRTTKDQFLKTILVGVLAGFIGILIQYNTFSILYIVHIWFIIGLLIALQNLAFKQHHQ